MRILALIICLTFLTGADLFGPRRAELKSGGDSGPQGTREQQAQALRMLQELPDSFDCEPSSDKIRCLLCNCYHESRGESATGQLAVIRTVYTREISQHYPNNICGVVYQKSQFSWTLDSSKRRKLIGPSSPGFNECRNTVIKSFPYRGQWYASHFHTHSVRPAWAKTCRGMVPIGNHKFYTGGCGGVRPETGSVSEEAVASTHFWNLFVSKAMASNSNSPLQAYLRENPDARLKTNFSDGVKQLLGAKVNPGLVEGDFNGDGQKDFVALLTKGDADYMVFFYSDGNQFKNKFKKIDQNPEAYLSAVPARFVKSGLPDKSPRDLVQLEIYYSSSTASYFIHGDKVIEFKGRLVY